MLRILGNALSPVKLPLIHTASILTHDRSMQTNYKFGRGAVSGAFTLTTFENPHWGIVGGERVEIFIFYQSRCFNWEYQLPKPFFADEFFKTNSENYVFKNKNIVVVKEGHSSFATNSSSEGHRKSMNEELKKDWPRNLKLSIFDWRGFDSVPIFLALIGTCSMAHGWRGRYGEDGGGGEWKRNG